MIGKLKETMPNELQERMMKRSCQIENINNGKEIIFKGPNETSGAEK